MPAVSLLHSVPPPAHDEHVAAVYRYAVANGIGELPMLAAALDLPIEVIDQAVDELARHRLLRKDCADPRRLVAVDPEVAAMALVSPMEREIYQRRELIAQVRQRTEMFRTDFSLAADTAPAAAGHRISGAPEVRGYLKMTSDGCQREVMMLQAGKQDTEEFDDFLQVCLQLLQRGVAVRIVCQHRSRADLTTRMKIKRVADAGAQVRTASHIPRTAVIFDRALAVLLGDSQDEVTASRVGDDDMVQFLIDVFDHLWDGATPVDTHDTGYAEVADDLQQTIAGLMAKGYTDEVLARKLGMSVRTCRRHIASLMRELDAVSRFQAGVRAGRRQLVEA
ncbi:MAG TPA: helix-turn-helix transcriptional regulator [Jatrophihabitans sp.]|nr:helix-turn-helix transcriptional regulator [Jatrophihabitans sp.]